jgi:hypothetical protein
MVEEILHCISVHTSFSTEAYKHYNTFSIKMFYTSQNLNLIFIGTQQQIGSNYAGTHGCHITWVKNPNSYSKAEIAARHLH